MEADVSPWTDLLATASRDGSIGLWDLRSKPTKGMLPLITFIVRVERERGLQVDGYCPFLQMEVFRQSIISDLRMTYMPKAVKVEQLQEASLAALLP